MIINVRKKDPGKTEVPGKSNVPLRDVLLAKDIFGKAVFCAIYSISIFVAFQALEKKLNSLPGKLLQLLSSMASATFFIYLFHVPFINWLGNNLRSERLNSLFYTYPIAKALFVFVVVGGLSLLWNLLKSSVSGWMKNRNKQEPPS